MPNDFSFAPHENDPTDIAKNPLKHHASASLSGAATGALVGTGVGAHLGASVGFRRARGLAGVGALVGSGLGAGLGYHHSEKKQRTVEQMYGGGNDPFALEKLSAEQVYQQGQNFARLYLMQKLAAANFSDAAQPHIEDAVKSFNYNALRTADDLLGLSAWQHANSRGTWEQAVASGHLHVSDATIAAQKSIIRNANLKYGPGGTTPSAQALYDQDRAVRDVLAREHNETVVRRTFEKHPLHPFLVREVLAEHDKRQSVSAPPIQPQTKARTTSTAKPPTQPASSAPPNAQPGGTPAGSYSGSGQTLPPRGGSAPRSTVQPPPQQTVSEAAQELWGNHKGKIGLGAAALALGSAGYYAYMQHQRNQADAMFQAQENPGVTV